MTRVIYRERIPSTDPRLGRHVLHDSESRRYPYRAARNVELRAVRHQRHVPIFDQGMLGSCVPNAALGALATGRLFQSYMALPGRPYTLDEPGAVQAYRDVTRMDPWPGAWEPDDTGSDGLSVAKLLTSEGALAGYQHTFTLADALAALMDQPLITGTVWLDGMFDPGGEGLVTPSGVEAGGHEYVVDEYDPVRGWVGFSNSWSPSWGVAGRFYMEAEKYGALLDRDGDVTVFVPAAAPPPQPEPQLEPATPADRVLRAQLGDKWVDSAAICARSRRKAARVWRASKDWT